MSDQKEDIKSDILLVDDLSEMPSEILAKKRDTVRTFFDADYEASAEISK